MYAPYLTKHRRKDLSILCRMILGVGTILVFTGLAVLRVEVDQDQRADKRNQSHEDEPTTLAGVLQAAY